MLDVAKAAGVSITTVSHVINRTASISPETAKRVLETIERIDYKPSVRASAVLKGESRTIGVLAPDFSNEFYSRFVQAICDTSWDNDYTTFLCSTRHNKQVSNRYVKEFIRNGIKGLILIGSMMDEKQILAAAERIPVVTGDCHYLHHQVSSVVTDNISAMRQLIKKLKLAGYRRIGYITQDLSITNVSERFTGIKTGLEENGLPYLESDIIISELLRMDRIANAHKLMSMRLVKKSPLPDVYVCSSDLIAVGVLAALTEMGYRIPKDIGVVGFDNISLAAYTRPPLTTIAQNMEQLGKSCFNTLLRRINNSNEPIQQIAVATKLIVRESVRL